MCFKVVLIVILCTTAAHTTAEHITSVFGSFFESRFSNFYNSVEEDIQNEHTVNEPVQKILVSEKEFTDLRIEYIKNQILKKLRLKEKPNVSQTSLPNPVKEYIPDVNDNSLSRYSDDFYGKTTQAIVFPYEDDARCVYKSRFPSACLPFQMPSDIHTTDVSTAELWFHKEKDTLDEHNQTFVISEVAHWDSNKSFQKNKPIAIQETNLTENWIKVDLTYVVKNWLDIQNEVQTHAVNIVCKTCGMSKTQSPISFTSKLRPFLVIYTHSQDKRTRQQHHRRPKRSTVCRSGVNECCKESFYISFSDIGWDDWIIKPDGYNAYFCKGSCLTESAITLSASQHNSILQKVMFNQNTNRGGARLELAPCCAATHFQPLQLVYMDNNKTLTTKVLSNMIVDTCGCM